MTERDDENLIEALARAACEADGVLPDASFNDGQPFWNMHREAARRHLAMQRAYEREMTARHEAWTHEMIETAPKQARGDEADRVLTVNECDHEWGLGIIGGKDKGGYWTGRKCEKCGVELREYKQARGDMGNPITDEERAYAALLDDEAELKDELDTVSTERDRLREAAYQLAGNLFYRLGIFDTDFAEAWLNYLSDPAQNPQPDRYAPPEIAVSTLRAERDRLQTQNTELLLLLDDWLMAFDLSGDHCELARAAERTRNLLTKNATEAHTAEKTDFPGGDSGKPKNAADWPPVKL